jgi:hypothetical protein
MGPNGQDKILEFFPDHKRADHDSMFYYYKKSVQTQKYKSQNKNNNRN